MEPLYHLVRQPIELKAGQDYQPGSLLDEGFVHLSLARQLEQIANLYLAKVGCLWVMELDPAHLCEIKFEDGGAGDLFPHHYGPIPHEAIIRQMPMGRDAACAWRMPPQQSIPLVVKFKNLPQ